ncbi:MAG: hypothetical protein KH127_02365 [Haemophilus parainfluenzae]|nr:hypothetical protein [Haemophilus parainfluenzae]
MKEFNLDAALNGEPVKLRSGHKAYICHKTPDCYVYKNGEKIKYPLHGFIIESDNMLEVPCMVWDINGRTYTDGGDGVFDVIGMWEEPKISIEDLPKPFYPEESNGYFYISDGKVAYNLYHSKYSESSLQIASNGQSFRTREDVQKWLDFMKSMME